MASTQMKENFKNATIDLEKSVIVEETKDGVLVYDLQSVLKRWDKIEGLTISIGKNADIEPDSTEY